MRPFSLAGVFKTVSLGRKHGGEEGSGQCGNAKLGKIVES